MPVIEHLDTFAVSAQLESCKIVRDRISTGIAELPLTDNQRADIKMAVGEAISNAIRHGCKFRDSETITVRCTTATNKLVIEITDPGIGFDPRKISEYSIPEVLPEGGMGIICMRRCMDEVSFDFCSGTTVRLVKLIAQ